MSNKIYDCDRHVMEPLEMWQHYVDADTLAQYPISFKVDDETAMAERVKKLGPKGGVPVPPTYLIGGEPILNLWDERLQVASANKRDSSKQRKDATTAQGQLSSMDESGISVARIFSTFAGFIVNHSQLPAKASLDYAEGYNRWLNDYCQQAPDRLKGVGLISRHDPQTMVEQVRKIIDFGWTCVTLRPEVILGRSLAHPNYEDFWQFCEDHNIAIAFHGGTHLHAPTVGTDRFTSRFALHACSHPMEAQMAFVSLLESGVLARHPKLKFGFLEAGASWVPHWLWRLDNICYPEFSELTEQNIKMLPSEYFKRQCWVAIEVEEPCLRQVVDMIGADRLIFGTDFPHPDHLDFDISDIKASCKDLTDTEIEGLLHHNALAFFGS